jgi:hypothetical protein
MLVPPSSSGSPDVPGFEAVKDEVSVPPAEGAAVKLIFAGRYLVAVPAGNDTLLTVAAANHLLKLPSTVPEVLDNVPSDEVLVPSVSVFVPVVMFPLVRVRVFATVSSACNVSPVELLIVRLFTVDGRPLPVLCAEVPLYV